MVSASSLAALFVALLAVAKGMGPLELEYGRTSRGHSSAIASTSKKVGDKAVDPQYLLQPFVDPMDYTLILRPVFKPDTNFPQMFTTTGSVVINVNCTVSSNYIQMHAHDTMNITSIKVETSTNANIYGTHDRQAANHFLNIRLTSSMAMGYVYKITIEFQSKIWEDKLDGLYYAKYNEISTSDPSAVVVKELVSTQFEAIGAREVFPCFDQPNYKSNFKISLRHKPTYTAFSNGKLKAGSPSLPDPEGWVISEFEETVKMPTYLIALIVSEHKCQLATKPSESTPPNAEFMDIDVGVCGRPEAVNAVADGGRNGAKKSADWSSKILKTVGLAFNFPYSNAQNAPMSKMHSVGLPDGYFGAGAMENWGLNTYRESYLMFFDGDSTESNKQTVMNILSHELAHQWFGNLVTCNWWQQIWLNEGFATIISYDAMKRLGNPEFADMMDYMLYDANQGALMNDIDQNMPVINKAQTVDEVDRVFGWNTYDKGGSLLRMMMSFMTEAEFVKGVSTYLNSHKYTSVEQDQFFAVMQTFAKNLPTGKTLKDVMDTYTLKPGYPLIQVKRRSAGSDAILISQEIYRDRTVPPPAHSGDYPNELWEVPLRIVTGNSAAQEVHPVFGTPAQQPNFWLNKNTVQVQYNNAPADWTWAIVNPNGGGYFRVLYEDAIIESIGQQLITDPTKIHALTRTQMIDDYFSFFTYGRHPEGLKMVKHLTEYLDTHVEKNRVVWSTLFFNFNRYLSILKLRSDANAAGSDFDVFAKITLLPKIKTTMDDLKCEVNDKTGSDAILCTQLQDWHSTLTSAGDANIRAAVLADIAETDPAKKLTPDQRQVYYCPALRGSAADSGDIYDEMVIRFADANNALLTKTVPKLEYTRIFNGLACVQGELLNNLLERTYSTDVADTKFRNNRVALLQRIATRSFDSRDSLWKKIDAGLDDFVKNFGKAETISVLNTIVSTMSEAADIANVNKFNTEHRAVIGQDIRTAPIDANIEWYEKYGKYVKTAWA